MVVQKSVPAAFTEAGATPGERADPPPQEANNKVKTKTKTQFTERFIAHSQKLSIFDTN
jgi:hypothetical protein